MPRNAHHVGVHTLHAIRLNRNHDPFFGFELVKVAIAGDSEPNLSVCVGLAK
jgi:hypothetical protein